MNDAYMRQIKWPDGDIECPHCAGTRCVERADKKRLRCKDCWKEFSYKTGTIFEDSPLPLSKWFVAVWSVANCKNGISSHELGRALGVTQKTAWFMLHRIREAMKTGSFKKLSGEVESDETFVGGLAKNMHREKRERTITGRGATGKAIVHGLLQRGGRHSVVNSSERKIAMGRKPKGFDAFDSLARKLVKVPRDELEKQLAKRKKRKRRKKD